MITVLLTIESRYVVDRAKLRARIEQFLKKKVHRKAEVSISIIGDRKMRRFNRGFRSIDKTTNVLSFALHEIKKDASGDRAFTQKHSSPDNVLRLGDVVVSYPQAVDEAMKQNKMVDDRIGELVEHGLNHLLGIHHD